MEIDLLTCSASVLADHVLQQRFGGNVAQSTQFFQQVIESIPSTTLTTTATTTDGAASSSTTLDFRNPLLETPLETSLLTPRGGKCSIQLYQNGFLVASLLKTPSTQLVIPAAAVSHLILFAKPEDFKLQITKKVPNAHLVLLKLRPDAIILFQSKPVQEQVCFSLSWVKGKGPTGPLESSTNGWGEATQAWRQVLEGCLGGSNNPNLITCQVQAGPSSPFISYSSPDQSTTTGGMPFVKCYQGVHDGVLYPLREGILFFKPPKFLPRSDLKSIACGRGSGGQSSSRYVDMVLQRHQDDTVEFTNIQREELAVLNQYIHQVLIPAMQADAKDGSSDAKPANTKNGADDETDDDDEEHQHEEEEEEESDEDDENFVDGAMDTDEEVEEDASDNDEDDDDFEVVDDDFAKELAKKSKSVRHDEPRASRSRKRKEMHRQSPDNDDDSSGVDDADFEVVQVGSSTESEGDGDRSD